MGWRFDQGARGSNPKWDKSLFCFIMETETQLRKCPTDGAYSFQICTRIQAIKHTEKANRYKEEKKRKSSE